MSDSLTSLDAVEMARLVAKAELSPVELVQAHLDRIDGANERVNAIVVRADDALDRARDAERAVTSGEPLGPLHGVPYTIKDSIDVAGFPTTSGSLITSRTPAKTDAPAVARIRDAGGVLLGKTNTPEFTLWWETDNRVFGRSNNPWNTDRTTGGSSGGEAAAIATGMSPLGIGSDSGGSIRVPAAYCNIFGLKATHGRVPITGHVPYALLQATHIGPLARSARDIALVLNVIEGPDGRDHYAPPVPATSFPDLAAPLKPLRVGFYTDGPVTPVAKEVQATVQAAADALAAMGHEVHEVDLPFLSRVDSLGASGAIAASEAIPDLMKMIGDREADLGVSMKRRLDAPKPTHEQHVQGLAVREALRAGFMEYFSGFDLLLCPATAVPAPPHDSVELAVDDQMAPGRTALMCTAVFDITGAPAISLPFGWSSEGLPIGVQLVGRHFDEATVVHAASVLAAAGDAVGKRPPLA
jgi:aspartyl-tRNA(Asn)/glutamyl-tRNA(Gln) amidotransferase subunit A